MASFPPPVDVPHLPTAQSEAAETKDMDGRVYIFTDGASRRNSNEQLRRAGYGAFWGVGHPANISRPLPGWAQTNQRAELSAVVSAMRVDSRRLHICTDSMYVVNGAARHHIWGARGGWRGDNRDLWEAFSSEMKRTPDRVQITHVKGHATWQDVERGRTTMFDKLGNDGADALAVAGASGKGFCTQFVACVK